jgi:GntR family transcriptional repressor for pyruvate dehydrogenase complex
MSRKSLWLKKIVDKHAGQLYWWGADWSDNRTLWVPHTLMPTARAEFEAIKKTKLYEKVAQQIQGLIRDGLLKPGDKLPPERELAETFQVSRSSLRDAIRTLEVMGLVEPRQGEGTIVCELSADSLVSPLSTMLLGKRELVSELLDLRRIIEPPLAARAAAHVTPDELGYMEDILARQKEKVDRGELAVEEDSEFHYAVASAAKNSVVLKVVDVFMDLLRESRARSLQVRGRLQKSFGGHRRILNAIRRHDSTEAELAMRRHIEEIEAIVLKEI